MCGVAPHRNTSDLWNTGTASSPRNEGIPAGLDYEQFRDNRVVVPPTATVCKHARIGAKLTSFIWRFVSQSRHLQKRAGVYHQEVQAVWLQKSPPR